MNKRVALILIFAPLITLFYLASQFTIENTFLPYKIDSAQNYDLEITSPNLAMGEFPKELLPTLKNLGFQVIYQKNWGLHRYLDFLKKLRIAPNSILFSLGESEAYEQRISLKHKDNFMKRYEGFKNSKLKISYLFNQEKIDQSKLPNYPNKMSLSHSNDILDYKSLLTKVLEIEIHALKKLSTSRNSKLSFLITPYSLKISKLNPCYSLPPKTKSLLRKVKKLTKNKKYQEAYSLNQLLLSKNKFHSSLNYQSGIINLRMRKNKNSIEHLRKALLFQCDLEQSIKPLINDSLKKSLTHFNVPYLDLEKFHFDQVKKNFKVNSYQVTFNQNIEYINLLLKSLLH